MDSLCLSSTNTFILIFPQAVISQIFSAHTVYLVNLTGWLSYILERVGGRWPAEWCAAPRLASYWTKKRRVRATQRARGAQNLIVDTFNRGR